MDSEQKNVYIQRASGVTELISRPVEEIEIAEKNNREIRQTEALATLAKAATDIANFLTSGGVSTLLSNYAKTQIAKDILGGLAAHDGRKALDAQTIKQNAIEIATIVEQTFSQLKEKTAAVNRDPEVHEATEVDPGTKYK